MPAYTLAETPASANNNATNNNTTNNNTTNNNMDAADRKKTFAFRMSKKVAELTQVVHMLFTRNHEKEVEIEALRDAYEHEVALVQADAARRIAALSERLSVLTDAEAGQSARAQADMERRAAREADEWRDKMAALERHLADEKSECQNARDLLIQAQNDLEKLRQGEADGEVSRRREAGAATREAEELKRQLSTVRRELDEVNEGHDNGVLALKSQNEKLQQDLTATCGNLADSEKARDQQSVRNKQLESELRLLKKELAKRSDRHSSTESRSDAKDAASLPEYIDELEWLRRELQRYRNELSNREENFNRMFTQQHPVVLDKRAGKLRYSVGVREPTFSLTASYHHPSASHHQVVPTPRPVLGVTMATSHASGSRAGSEMGESDIIGSPRQSHRMTARFPQLGVENRRQPSGGVARLAKPRPLPRELLSAKASGQG